MSGLWRIVRAGLLVSVGVGAAVSAESATPETFRQYCFGCHGKAAMAGLNLEQLATHGQPGEHFQHWEKVAAALEKKHMPPAKMPQPSEAERRSAVDWIRGRLKEYAERHAGDPGRVTVRRLTGGEYAYTIRDLTGLDLKVDFSADSVGGEGFTNFGDVQFMEDAKLERYLESAKKVAEHAVIGAGPLEFFTDPGKSGFELSAIHRIQEIYRKNGFRAASGEGGKPYGLERYGQAFYVAWRFRHRAALGQPAATLEQMAAAEGLSARFARHIWTVLNRPAPAYPVSEVVARWRALPAPGGDTAAVRAGSKEIQRFVIDWPRWLLGAGAMAEGGEGDERALVLTAEAIAAQAKGTFKFPLRRRKERTARIYFNVVSVNPGSRTKPVVRWRNPKVRFLRQDRSSAAPVALASLVDEASRARLGWVEGADEFQVAADRAVFADVTLPADAGGLEVQVEAELEAAGSGSDAVARCTVSESEDLAKGRPSWALLADPESAGYRKWKQDVLAFAAQLPQTSHGEPTPSDKDPIPAPFNNVYNQPERDHFHTKLKYYRTDRFLTEMMLDDAARKRLDAAWADLLSSFEYHDEFLRFVARKFDANLGNRTIADLDEAAVEAMPEAARPYVRELRREFHAVRNAQMAAQPRHLEDCLEMAGRAWRRPLRDSEKDRLRAFYSEAREGQAKLSHDKAIRALLARVLVSPAFLYRLEDDAGAQPAVAGSKGRKPLGDWELASRLSYFLWASAPDEELRRAAGAGELRNTDGLRRQVKRMLADAKAQRLATEFFGQWLGFYRFDEYRGVDTSRFPEFTDEIKADMYEEATAFFDYVVRQERPLREMLFADYTFVTPALARHYGIQAKPEGNAPVKVAERGGLLRLGAVLTVTSAPLRTSPVKRGDWLLRRVLGTPTPPPPADAGSIPADDKSFGGMTVRERLAAHQRNATCAACHSRIDPLGFPLERFDPVGRWREKYPDGKAIHDASELGDRTAIDGINGLLAYLRTQESQVMQNFSRKLIGYALGRTMLASDQPLVERLTAEGGGATFGQWATEIVLSEQFRYRRSDEPAAVGKQTAARMRRREDQ